MPIVSSAEFQRHLGLYQDKAMAEPVTITRNGRERLVLLSVEEFQRLKRRDRSVFATQELPAEKVAAVKASRMDRRHKRLDAELKTWKS